MVLESSDLRLPHGVVEGETVDEDDGKADARAFVAEEEVHDEIKLSILSFSCSA